MKIAVFHGTMGSPAGNWFPWLERTLAPLHSVTIPALPTPEGQTLTNWVTAVQNQIPDLKSYDILIGHSCGASFIPHLVLTLGLVPKKIIMVSPFTGPLGFPLYDTLNQSFFLLEETLSSFYNEINLKNITPLIFHGDNDPYVPLKQAQQIATALDTPLHIITNGGHLNAESGYTEFPEILDALA